MDPQYYETLDWPSRGAVRGCGFLRRALLSDFVPSQCGLGQFLGLTLYRLAGFNIAE